MMSYELGFMKTARKTYRHKVVTGFLCLLCMFFSTYRAQAQGSSSGSSTGGSGTVYTIYYSAQNKVATTYTGSYSKTTDSFEHGTLTISTTGPITHTVNPADLQIGVGSSKTWSGNIRLDTANAPAPGSSAAATITGTYDIYYSCPADRSCPGAGGTQTYPGASWTCDPSPSHPCAAGHTSPGPHRMVREQRTKVYNFMVHSIKVKISGPDTVCKGDTGTYTATVYPAGGTLTWSTGQTGASIKVPITVNTTIVATYTHSGVSYKDTLSVFARPISDWATSHTVTIPGWSATLAKIDLFKDNIKSAVKKIPAELTISGPEVSFDWSYKDCCHLGQVKERGKNEVSVTVSGSIGANDIPLAPPPWSGSFVKDITAYGYGFTVKLKYGLLMSASAGISGKLGYKKNFCDNTDCLFGSAGVNFNASVTVKGEAGICLIAGNGKKNKCPVCKKLTTNWCGYCDDHTSESWWCTASCPQIALSPGRISTNIYAKLTYNEPACNSGLHGSVGMGSIVYDFSFTFLKYTISRSYELWEGKELYKF